MLANTLNTGAFDRSQLEGTSAAIPARLLTFYFYFYSKPFKVKQKEIKEFVLEVLSVLIDDGPGGEALALFLRPYPGAFGQLMCPHPRGIYANARVLARAIRARNHSTVRAVFLIV